MEFLVKIQAPDSLRQRDIIKDLQDGLHFHVGSGDPECEYLQALSRVKVKKYSQPKKLTRAGSKV